MNFEGGARAIRGWPDPGEILFLTILGVLVFSAPTYLFSDGGTGWHLLTGRYLLERWAVPRTDFLSYTFTGRPWVAFEWLADATLAALEALGGLPAVAVGCAAAIGALFFALYRDMRATGCAAAVALTLCVAGSAASSVHWLARPHLAGFWATYGLCRILDRHWYERTSTVRLVLSVAAILLLWANAHPSFPLGLALVGIFFAWAWLAALTARRQEARGIDWLRTLGLGLALAAGAAVTLLNPYGLALHAYIARHLADPVLQATTEFRPPALDGSLPTSCFFALLALLGLGLALRPRRAAVPRSAAALALAALALRGIRHVPVFVIVALPLLGQLFARSGADGSPARPERVPVAAIVASMLLLAVAIAGQPIRDRLGLSACDFDVASFPSGTLAWIRNHRLPPQHGFALDNWGGFIAYRLGMPVFIDDRSDFFPRGFTRDYIRMIAAEPEAAALLERYGIDWVLVPRTAPLSRMVAANGDWRLASEDAGARLYVRRIAASRFSPLEVGPTRE